MDDFSIHLQQLRRRFPAELQVAHLGNMPCKSHIERREFSTFNFSIVFRGTGFYEWRGTVHPVRGPTVLRQWPGEPMHYGPTGTWHELFIIYPPAAANALVRRGYVTSDRPLWEISETRNMQRHLDDLSKWLADTDALSENIDRIDRACEQLILESLMGAVAAPKEMSADRVESVRRWIEIHWRDDHDFDALALNQGLSPTHFRRLWQQAVSVPPHRYLIEQRLRHACRALVQSDAPIAEIAQTHGFPDPLYFSRRFRAFTGESARTYRQRYRASLQF